MFTASITAATTQLATHLAAGHSALCDEEPGCGTKVPGFHPPHPHPLESVLNSNALDEVALNPQPLPPRQSGPSALTAQFTDDEQCGTVPRHWPPVPTPQPWADAINVAALHPDVSAMVNGLVG